MQKKKREIRVEEWKKVMNKGSQMNFKCNVR